jgi:hypothetical protein
MAGAGAGNSGKPPPNNQMSLPGLALAAAADAAGGHAFIFSGLRAKHRSPLAALLGLADCMAVTGKTPDEVAHTLAFLQMDLTGPENWVRATPPRRDLRTVLDPHRTR